MTPWVMRLLLANLVAFVLAQPGTRFFQMLMFVPVAVLERPWTLVTYMFLHGGMMHIFFNMLALYFFGPRLEARIGSKDFIKLYLIAGLAGAILSFVFEPRAAIVGASGAVFGVLYGFAHYWPHERIMLIFPPIPIPARVLVIGFAAISVFSGFTGAGAGIAHFAHLGGFAGGWGYLKLRERRSSAFRRKATQGAEPTAMERVSGKAARDEKRWESIRLDGLHEINRQEVERIRTKIETSGAGSLTADERAFMNRMVD